MSDDDNQDGRWKLTFAPGCFDGFEGSQEELDELVAIIKSKFEDGSLFQDSMPIEQILAQNPEVAEWVEGLTDEEVTAMLETIDVFAQYPEINHTLH